MNEIFCKNDWWKDFASLSKFIKFYEISKNIFYIKYIYISLFREIKAVEILYEASTREIWNW